MKIERHQKLVIIGDSITDTGRSRPIGEGRNDALGKGYVLEIDALLGSFYPELGIRVANVGSSGNTVRDLKARWQTDVLDLKPDWLAVMIGANDVWRQHDLPWLKEKHVCLEEYETTLDDLCTQTRQSLKGLKGLILMTPFFIEPNRQDAMRAMMDRYGAAVKKIASKHAAIFVDTQAAFDEALKHYYSATLSWDRVHPNHIGHMIIAKSFLKEIGFEYTKHI